MPHFNAAFSANSTKLATPVNRISDKVPGPIPNQSSASTTPAGNGRSSSSA
jgi:hypothetical protein